MGNVNYLAAEQEQAGAIAAAAAAAAEAVGGGPDGPAAEAARRAAEAGAAAAHEGFGALGGLAEQTAALRELVTLPLKARLRVRVLG